MATEIRGTTGVDVRVVGIVPGGATALTVADATGLPAVTAGQYFRAALYDASEETAGGKWEIVYVTARSGTALTVQRAQEGTDRGTYRDDCHLRLQPTDLADTLFAGAETIGLAELKHEAKDRLPALPASPADNAKVLTASAGAMVWAAAPGSGSLSKVTVSLLDADIKGLPTTPVEIIPAPGAGLIIVPLHAVFMVDAVAGGYTNVNAACIGGLAHEAGIHPPTVAFVELDEATSDVSDFLNSGDVDTSAGILIQSANPAAKPYAWEWLEDKALELRFDNDGDGDFTGGHVANTGSVTVYYYVLDTGLVAS